MRSIAVRLATAAGTAVLPLLAAGYGSPASAGSQSSMPDCTSFGVYAITHTVTVTRVPAACAGLSTAERDQALSRAVYLATGTGRHKVAWRERAGAASRYLGDLIAAVPPPPAAGPSAADAPAARAASGGTDRPTIVALLAWLFTASTGGYILAQWILGGRRRTAVRRSRGRGTRLPSRLVSGHLGLAVAGLGLWSAYLGTGWRPMAWTAVALLLPVAGLGMAVLFRGVAPVVHPGVAEAQAGSGGGNTPGARGHRALFAAASHGALASATLVLVVLAAIGTR